MSASASSSWASRHIVIWLGSFQIRAIAMHRISFQLHIKWTSFIFNLEKNTYFGIKIQIIAVYKVKKKKKKWEFSFSLAPFHSYYPEVSNRNSSVYKMDFSKWVLWLFFSVIEKGGSNSEGCGLYRGLWVSLYQWIKQWMHICGPTEKSPSLWGHKLFTKSFEQLGTK